MNWNQYAAQFRDVNYPVPVLPWINDVSDLFPGGNPVQADWQTNKNIATNAANMGIWQAYTFNLLPSYMARFAPHVKLLQDLSYSVDMNWAFSPTYGRFFPGPMTGSGLNGSGESCSFFDVWQSYATYFWCIQRDAKRVADLFKAPAPFDVQVLNDLRTGRIRFRLVCPGDISDGHFSETMRVGGVAFISNKANSALYNAYGYGAPYNPGGEGIYVTDECIQILLGNLPDDSGQKSVSLRTLSWLLMNGWLSSPIAAQDSGTLFIETGQNYARFQKFILRDSGLYPFDAFQTIAKIGDQQFHDWRAFYFNDHDVYTDNRHVQIPNGNFGELDTYITTGFPVIPFRVGFGAVVAAQVAAIQAVFDVVLPIVSTLEEVILTAFGQPEMAAAVKAVTAIELSLINTGGVSVSGIEKGIVAVVGAGLDASGVDTSSAGGIVAGVTGSDNLGDVVDSIGSVVNINTSAPPDASAPVAPGPTRSTRPTTAPVGTATGTSTAPATATPAPVQNHLLLIAGAIAAKLLFFA